MGFGPQLHSGSAQGCHTENVLTLSTSACFPCVILALIGFHLAWQRNIAYMVDLPAVPVSFPLL
jgi:hypothetical protein